VRLARTLVMLDFSDAAGSMVYVAKDPFFPDPVYKLVVGETYRFKLAFARDPRLNTTLGISKISAIRLSVPGETEPYYLDAKDVSVEQKGPYTLVVAGGWTPSRHGAPILSVPSRGERCELRLSIALQMDVGSEIEVSQTLYFEMNPAGSRFVMDRAVQWTREVSDNLPPWAKGIVRATAVLVNAVLN
jgi:hypothetical protein